MGGNRLPSAVCVCVCVHLANCLYCLQDCIGLLEAVSPKAGFIAYETNVTAEKMCGGWFSCSDHMLMYFRKTGGDKGKSMTVSWFNVQSFVFDPTIVTEFAFHGCYKA